MSAWLVRYVARLRAPLKPRSIPTPRPAHPTLRHRLARLGARGGACAHVDSAVCRWRCRYLLPASEPLTVCLSLFPCAPSIARLVHLRPCWPSTSCGSWRRDSPRILRWGATAAAACSTAGCHRSPEPLPADCLRRRAPAVRARAADAAAAAAAAAAKSAWPSAVLLSTPPDQNCSLSTQ